MFRAVLEETKRAAARVVAAAARRVRGARGVRVGHAGGGAADSGSAFSGARGGKEQEPRVGARRRRGRGDRERDRERRGGRRGSIPDGDGDVATRSAARADHGEWPRVELRMSSAQPAAAVRRRSRFFSKIPADAFFASLDQMSANGQGARARGVALAEWLEDHLGDSLPTARLVLEGASDALNAVAEGGFEPVVVRIFARRLPRPLQRPPTQARVRRGHRGSRVGGGRCATTPRCSNGSRINISTSTPRSSVTCRFPVPDATGRIRSTLAWATPRWASPRWVTPRWIGRPARVIVFAAGFAWTTASPLSAFSLRPERRPGIRRRWTRFAPRRRRFERSWTNSRGRRRRRTWCRGWITSSSFGSRGNDAAGRRFGKRRFDSSVGDPGEEDEEVVVYVMDSLGERLCEGCKRGYVLRFDGSSSPACGGGAAAAAARFIRIRVTVAASAADRRGRGRVRVRGEGRERAVVGAAHAQAPDRVSQGAEGIVGRWFNVKSTAAAN